MSFNGEKLRFGPPLLFASNINNRPTRPGRKWIKYNCAPGGSTLETRPQRGVDFLRLTYPRLISAPVDPPCASRRLGTMEIGEIQIPVGSRAIADSNTAAGGDAGRTRLLDTTSPLAPAIYPDMAYPGVARHCAEIYTTRRADSPTIISQAHAIPCASENNSVATAGCPIRKLDMYGQQVKDM